MHQPVPTSIRSALKLALVLVATSCSSDVTGPDPASSVPIGGFTRVNGNRGHRSANGVVFTLDHRAGTLTAAGGKTVRLRPDLFTRLEKDFDAMEAVEARTAHFKAQKDYARVRQLPPQRSSYRILPSGSAAPSTTSGARSAGPRLGPGASGDIYDGMTEGAISCLEIAQTIYAEQPVYDHAREALDEALFDAGQAGSRGEWDPGDYIAVAALEVADWNYQVELMKMNFLAVLYNSYNCWDNNWTDASTAGSGGGGGDGGGGGGCYEQYGSIDISYDGGATWDELWSGWYSVCGEMAA